MPWGGASGQNLGHLRVFISFAFFLLWNHSFLNSRYYFLVDSLCDVGPKEVYCPRVGLEVKI